MWGPSKLSMTLSRVLVVCFALVLVVTHATKEEESAFKVNPTKLGTLKDSNFEYHVKAADENNEGSDFLVMFESNHCHECIHMEAALVRIRARYPEKDLRFAKVNCFKSSKTCARVEVSHYPQVVYFSKGFMYTFYGDYSEKDLIHFINELMEGSMPTFTEKLPVPPVPTFFQRVRRTISGMPASGYALLCFTVAFILLAIWPAKAKEKQF
mmetsp:Transcript_23921/g.44417  ORF Transcript_23921/g.44417 Transcript_23921/m.44417 type:complete len:211 (+) Transcript_23921:248-880(+)